MELKTCVDRTAYDVVLWLYLAMSMSVVILTSCILVSFMVWFRGEACRELWKKRRYSRPLGALWIQYTSSLIFTVLDRYDTFVGFDRLANSFGILHVLSGSVVQHFIDMNTRDTAAAISKEEKKSMKKVGFVAHFIIVLEFIAAIIGLILDKPIIAFSLFIIRFGIINPIHIVAFGRIKLAVFVFLEGLNDPEKQREFKKRKKRFCRTQINAIVIAVSCIIVAFMFGTQQLYAFFILIPGSLGSSVGLFMCPILARRLFDVKVKVAPDNRLVKFMVVQSEKVNARDSERESSGIPSENPKEPIMREGSAEVELDKQKNNNVNSLSQEQNQISNKNATTFITATSSSSNISPIIPDRSPENG